MKQIIQNFKTGATKLVEVPTPIARANHILIRSAYSLISSGTERATVDFGRAGLIKKARKSPDKVHLVLDKIKTDGLQSTLDAVLNKLDQPLPLGYCNAGVVMDVGSGVTEFAVGDRVVSNGNHADAVCVPANLCAKIPNTVSDEEAAFTIIGSIALQGIRLCQPSLGEAAVVTGLGLVGLMTVQLLRASGCRVLGMDFDKDRLALARQFGADVVDLSAGQDPIACAERFSHGLGVDFVIITASTKSNEPVHQAALMCRKRARIVLVGVTGLKLSRADFYEKELTFQVSCSYGPGRYDANYEEKGNDYPVGFVRWTEQRNFGAVLEKIATGCLDVKPLVSHRFAIEEVNKAYEVVSGTEASLGILFKYFTPEERPDSVLRTATVMLKPPVSTPGKLSLAFIGAGGYATAVLIPAFKNTGVRLYTVASRTGLSGVHAASKHGFEQTTTDTEGLFGDKETNAIVIATRHDSHARFVLKALAAGKHVFVEKPLALRLDELTEIETAYGRGQSLLMVGFNRRFAPQVQKIKALIRCVSGPKAFVMTVNAGAIPAGHWTQDPEVGGGRVIGEACHFIDLLRFLAGKPIVEYRRMAMDTDSRDTVTLQLGFADGSIGTVHYYTNGNRSFPKERLEVFADGRILRLDNFRRLKGYGWPGFRKMNLWQQDKGQTACVAAFVNAVKNGGDPPIALDELLEVGRVTIALSEP